MKSKLFAVLAAGVVLLMISGPMFAHHGGAQYDTKHAVTVTGNVTEYMFTNGDGERDGVHVYQPACANSF